jgi:hypothetical protein
MSARTIPAIPEDADVLRAALLYAACGIYVLPVDPDTKRPARELGNGWQHKTSIDTEQIVAWFSGTNYLLGIHVGRSGLIVFDVDDYDMLPPELLREFSENPCPTQSTRLHGERGHRVYRQPEGRNFGNSLGELRRQDKAKWGEIRGANGIIVVQPSHHTNPDGRYLWLNPGEIPVLSDRISNLLPDVNLDEAGTQAASDEIVKRFLTENVGNNNPQFLKPIIEKFGREANNGSRHEALVRALCWAMRDSLLGDFPAREAARLLREDFLLVMGTDRFPKQEFWGVLAYAVAQAGLIDVEARLAERKARLAQRDEENGWSKRGDVKTNKNQVVLKDPYDPYGTPPTVVDIDDEEDDENESPLDDDESGDFRTGARDRDGKVRINIGDKAKAMEWLREEMGRGSLSGLFLRGKFLVHTPLIGEDGYVPPKYEGADDGPAQVRIISIEGLQSMLETRYNIGRVEVNKKTEKKQWRKVLIPKDMVSRCIGSAEVGDTPNLRHLHGITHTPVIRPDGSIFDRPGYDSVTKMLYLPTQDMGSVAVPENPSPAQIAEAKATIIYPVSQFPFVTPDDLANWLGCAFTPLLRPLVPPPYQFAVIEAPSPGSGKGYLLGVLRELHGAATRPGMPSRDDEWNKVVMTMLSGTTAPIIAFDNVRGVVHSAVLEGLLTTGSVSDRTLGKNNEYMEVPNDRLWAMTGNNAQIGGDLARRTLRITIDPKVPDPETRTGFRCNPVMWTKEKRAQYVTALLTLVRAWVVAGRPMPKVKRSDDYANWVRTVRGILEFAGFEGIFSNQEEKKERSAEDEEWFVFLEGIVDSFGLETPFTAKDIYLQIPGGAQARPNGVPIEMHTLPGDLAEKFGMSAEARFCKSLGLWLKNRVGRYAGDLKVVDLGKGKSGPRKNVQVYQIERAEQAPFVTQETIPGVSN